MEIIRATHIEKTFNSKQVLNIQHFQMNAGDRIGLIGANGSGKSTLLRILLGVDRQYTGQVRCSVTTAYVPQLKAVSQESGGEQTLGYLHEAIDQYAACLVLDEPTTNLDMLHTQWLIDQLKYYPGALLVVSHDRHFLDEVVTEIYELKEGDLRHYTGNYTAYEQRKAEERAAQEIAYEEYIKKKTQLEAEASNRLKKASRFKKKKKSVSRSEWKVNSRLGKYDAQQKAMAQAGKALERRLERLEAVEKPKRDRFIKFKSNQAVGAARTLLHLQEGTVSIEGKELFTYPMFKMIAGEKVLLSGPNKAGKTTFLRAIACQALAGYYQPHLKIAYFWQNLKNLVLERDLLYNVEATSDLERRDIYNAMATLGFRYERMHEKAGELSGGERVLLQLAKVLLSSADLILLDEPTNYLDIVALEALEQFLNYHEQAYIIVSHDQAFKDRITAKEYAITDGKLTLIKD